MVTRLSESYMVIVNYTNFSNLIKKKNKKMTKLLMGYQNEIKY